MSNIIYVTNAAELAAALETATGGESIELAPGEYEDLYFSGLQYESTVTITSADPYNLANIRSLALVGSSNIKVDNIFFDYDPNEDTLSHSSAVIIDRSENITLTNSTVKGGPSIIGIPQDSDAGEQGPEGILGLPNGRGITVISSHNVRIENNEVSEFFRGIILASSDNVEVLGNEVHHTRASTLAGGDLNNILVEGNYFHSANPWNFGGAGDHGDYIFFWTGRDQTEPSENIIIRNNVADQGDGIPLLGIILGDRSEADVGFTNSEISGNVINNGHHISISVNVADGVLISDNTLLQSSGDAKDSPKILIDSFVKNAVIENNILYGFIDRTLPENNVQFKENLIIQGTDPNADNYDGKLFVNSEILNYGTLSFKSIPGSLADGKGSSLMQFDWSPDTLTPHFQVNSDEESVQTLIFDASLTVGPLGLVSENDVEFQWDFGDGNTATGRIVKHDFASAGRHDVTLTVIAKDGTIAQAKFTAGVAGEDILQFNSQMGFFEALAYGEETALDGSVLPLQNTADGYALKLGGEGTQASVAAAKLLPFFGTNSFEMSMSLKADSAASWGEVARIHTSFTISVDQSGNLHVTLFLDNGSRVHIASEGIVLNNGTEHDVTIRFDGKVGFAEIVIDGQVLASEVVAGSLGGGANSLTFGNPWGKQNFDGELTAFTLSAESRDFPVYDGDAVPVSGIETTTPEEAPVVDNRETVTSEPIGAEDTTPVPESDPTPTEPVEEPASEEETNLTEPLFKGGYQLDIASATTSDSLKLHDDTNVAVTATGTALFFDGHKDYVSLGRLTDFETSQKLAFSVDFLRNNTDDTAERLVWNHLKLGLTLESDGLRVHAHNADEHFSRGFKIEGLGLNDGNLHNVTVMVDAETDRLQVVVNNVLVLDEQETDFDFVGAGGREWGWSLGTAWNRWFEGEVHNFAVTDNFVFLDQPIVDEAAVLV